MSVSGFSISTQNYLKAIWSLQEWTEAPTTPSLIAQRVGLRLSTVSGALPKLAEQGLVVHEPYSGVALTEAGRAVAVAMVRRHRLLETFLVQTLGYGWDEVHEEAEHLEHAVSDLMVERIDALLGRPERDPHGDPIPDAQGRVTSPSAVPLTDVQPGARVVVERISDADSALLKHLASRGITVGTVLEVGEGEPFSGALSVAPAGTAAPAGGEATSLGATAAAQVFVSVRG
ncbi:MULTISPECIES: metal-dependent transcriptional regulator [Brevibacterium]|jgi:DtxR family Mn-dependent transcriptional regulator|uniref:Manganese transport regulator n=1 Tax=Brevibacterium salitolerans TaxID=1403566 RepID=A0ABP5IRF1_9MICO|nr:metal-dependent transcriptional regulator [Brevibacterium sp.]